jgi:hypothetical protein
MDINSHPLYIACASVIDYVFYIPSGQTQVSLNNETIKKLNNSVITILPPTCQSAIRKVVCSSIYLKCFAGVDLNNKSSWNSNIYADIGVNLALPFYRPCKRLCTQMNSECFQHLRFMGVDFDCNEKYHFGFDISTEITPQVRRYTAFSIDKLSYSNYSCHSSTAKTIPIVMI